MSDSVPPDAAVVEFFHQRAEKPEVVMRGAPDRFALGRRMRVRRVGADGDMDGNGRRCAIRFVKQAGRVTAYGSLDDSKIAMCNAGAPAK